MGITLRKAIEISRINLHQSVDKVNNDLYSSQQLGLMALEAINYARHGHSWSPTALLPDELPEQMELPTS